VAFIRSVLRIALSWLRLRPRPSRQGWDVRGVEEAEDRAGAVGEIQVVVDRPKPGFEAVPLILTA
jgi:hypothetical protein